MDLNKLEEYLKSEEGQKDINYFIKKRECEQNILNYQLKKFYKKFYKKDNFEEFTDKVIKKYTSKKYKDRWYKRGIEPPETLFWFLFNYAKRYGRECSEEEWEKYGNTFTSELFFINGYYFNKMDGQGSKIKIIKIY